MPHEDREYRLYPSRLYGYVATGDLRLRICGAEALRARQTWADAKKQRLEACLGGFVLGLQQVAGALKLRRAGQAERKRQYELERQRQVEAELAGQLEDARVGELDGPIARWPKARFIRDFVDAVRAAGVAYLPEEVKIKTLDDWLQWAGEYAAGIDPLGAPAPELLYEHVCIGAIGGSQVILQ
jgi:hypothetical protein